MNEEQHAAYWRGYNDCKAAQEAELRRLREANAELLKALQLVQIDCQYLHHAKNDRHSLSEDCPVAARINAAIAKHESES